MKTFIALIFYLFTFSIRAQVIPDNPGQFIIGAEHLSTFDGPSNEYWNDAPLPHSDTYWNLVRDFGLNYGGMLYYQTYDSEGFTSTAKIQSEITKANSYGVKVFLWNGFLESRFPRRWIYQVENNLHDAADDFLSYGTGEITDAPNSGAERHWYYALDVSALNYWILRTSSHSAGDVVKNVKTDNLQPDNTHYWVKVKMRLPVLPPSATNVITVEAKNKTTGDIESGIISSSAFTTTGWKEVTVFDFEKTSGGPLLKVNGVPSSNPTSSLYGFTPGVPDYVVTSATYTPYDIRIYWHDIVDCDIDYVMIDDYDANQLYTNNYDTRMTNLVDNYKSYAAMRYFKVWDEPYAENQYPVRRMNNYIQQRLNSTGYPEKSPFTYQWYFGGNYSNDIPKRYLYETQMNKVIADIYPVFLNTPNPGEFNYLSVLQSRFDSDLIPGLKNSFGEAKNFGMPFYFCIQAHKWDVSPDQNWLREPSAYEIKAMANLGVCYGAKGIKYYLWSNNSDAGTDNRIGLLDVNETATTTPTPRYTDAYGYPKWNTLKDLNQKLGVLGPTLINLTWQGAKSWHNGQYTSGWSGYVSAIDAKIGGVSDDPDYVETGHFINTLGTNYLFVVNRRTLSTESRGITINFSLPSGSYEILDVASGNTWIISSSNGNFTDTFAPGEGKLYKISPAIYTTTRTIPSGATLTVNAGVIVKFSSSAGLIVNGKLLVDGTLSQPVAFTSISGNTPQSWGSIVLNGSGANNSSINYANISFGTRVQVSGAANVTIQNCNVTDVYYGIDYTGSTGSILNNQVNSTASYYGIVVENSSTVTCRQNTVKKTGSRWGMGIIYSGGGSGYIAKNDVRNWYWGISAIWGSSPYFYNSSADGINNRITSCDYGVMVYMDSYPTVAVPISNFYGNSIYSNYKNIGLNIYYSTTSSLSASQVWWGGTPTSSMFELGNGSSLNYVYNTYLYSDPWSGIPLPVAPEKGSEADTLAQEKISSELLNGIILLTDGRQKEAKDAFLLYLNKNPNDQSAYAHLYNCYTEETASEITKYFESLPKEAEKDQKMLLAYLYLKQGNISFAKKVNTDLITGNPNTLIGMRAKINNAYIALYNEDDVDMALTLSKEVSKFSELSASVDLILLQQAIETYVTVHGGGKFTNPKQSSNGELISTDNVTLQNYPNPFNPTTTITYSLPEDGNVRLVVYDYLGKEVAELINGLVQQGSHEVQFNASSLASGIYFYRLTAGNHSIIKKMLILK